MGIVKKSNKLYSIFNLKCPRCHSGDLFKTPTFSFNKPFDMPKSCSKCGQDFEPEPGFYFGAMFISYIFTGFFCLGFTMILHWVIGWSTAASFGALIAVCAIFFVYIFRLARSIWININIKYDPQQAALATDNKQ
jgi:uncharacterized protein (DUF983 family)